MLMLKCIQHDLVKMNGLYIEITNACNLHCSFCPCGKQGDTPRIFMDSTLFERCIAEAETVTEQVYFHVLGEPTLHPGFVHYLKKLEHTHLKLTLTTNGTTIERVGKAILASPAVRQVNFSTHAYAELPLGEATERLQNVMDFCEMANAIRPDLYINLRLWNVGDSGSSSWNGYMLDQVNRAFRRIGANPDGSDAPITLEHFCSRHKSFLVQGRIYLHQDSRFEWPSESAKDACLAHTGSNFPRGTCRALDTHAAILHDGRVVACCLDHSGKITLGRIQEQSLNEILSSSAAASIREGFANHELRHPFCQSCNFCKRFK